MTPTAKKWITGILSFVAVVLVIVIAWKVLAPATGATAQEIAAAVRTALQNERGSGQGQDKGPVRGAVFNPSAQGQRGGGVVRQRVEHPFANVPPARQYRCAVGPNGQMVAANPGTGWCYDE